MRTSSLLSIAALTTFSLASSCKSANSAAATKSVEDLGVSGECQPRTAIDDPSVDKTAIVIVEAAIKVNKAQEAAFRSDAMHLICNSRAEPGVLHYDMHDLAGQDPQSPYTEVRFIEAYASAAVKAAHLSGPNFLNFVAKANANNYFAATPGAANPLLETVTSADDAVTSGCVAQTKISDPGVDPAAIVVVEAKIKVNLPQVAAFKAATDKLICGTRSEPGVLFYQMNNLLEQPAPASYTEFRFIEEYSSATINAAHLNGPNFLGFIQTATAGGFFAQLPAGQANPLLETLTIIHVPPSIQAN